MEIMVAIIILCIIMDIVVISKIRYIRGRAGIKRRIIIISIIVMALYNMMIIVPLLMIKEGMSLVEKMKTAGPVMIMFFVLAQIVCRVGARIISERIIKDGMKGGDGE